MTKLIPLDAAIAAVNLAIWKSPIKSQISTIDASNDTAEALHALPTIDPAAIRDAALREAAELCDRYPYVEGVKTAILDLIKGEKK